ncbi:MAG: TraC family protein [Proteobacteria bacterium]|nr:TraC family protein [Pseudomonadota bacterium]
MADGKFKQKFKALKKTMVDKARPHELPPKLNLKQMQMTLDRFPLSAWLPYDTIEDDGIWIDDNPDGVPSFLFGFELEPFLSVGEKTELALESMLSDLPRGTIALSVRSTTGAIHQDMKEWYVSQRRSLNPMYEMIAKERSRFYIEWSEKKFDAITGSNYRPRKMRYHFFVKTAPIQGEHTQEDYEKVYKSAQKLKSQILAGLNTGGFAIHKKLTGGEIYTFIHDRLNLALGARELASKKHSTQITPSSINMQDKRVTVSINDDGMIESLNKDTSQKVYSNVLTINEFLDENAIFLSSFNDAVCSVNDVSGYVGGDIYAFSIFESLSYKDDVSAGTALKMISGEKGAEFEGNKFISMFVKGNKEKRQKLNMAHYKFSKEKQPPVRVLSGVILSNTDLDELERDTKKVETRYGKIGINLYQEDTIGFDVYLASLPGFFRKDMDGADTGLQRALTMTAFNAGLFMHCVGAWSGNHPSCGGALTMNRLGGVSVLDVFNDCGSNFNMFVGADSGSGKSFFVNEVVRSILSKGGYVRIIDAGRSYQTCCELVGGKVIEFGDGSDMCINPFDGIYDLKQLEDEELDHLTSVCLQMAYPETYGDLNQSGNKQAAVKEDERNIISRLIRVAWKACMNDNRTMSIRDVRNAIIEEYEQKKQSVLAREDIVTEKLLSCYESLVNNLYDWSEGAKSKWVVGESTLSFDNPFIILELDGLDKNLELRSIVINLLLNKLTEEMYIKGVRDPETGETLEKLLVLDEAWDLINRPATAVFMEKASRRVRKYQGSMIILTQKLTDAISPAGKTIINNSNLVVVMKQNAKAVEEAIDDKLVDFNETHRDLISEVRKTNDFSEFFVLNKMNHMYGLLRFKTDAFSYLLFTSKVKEKDAIAKLVAQGYSKQEALAQLASKVKQATMFNDDVEHEELDDEVA